MSKDVVMLSVRLPRDQAERLQRIAKTHGLTLSDIARLALDMWMDDAPLPCGVTATSSAGAAVEVRSRPGPVTHGSCMTLHFNLPMASTIFDSALLAPEWGTPTAPYLANKAPTTWEADMHVSDEVRALSGGIPGRLTPARPLPYRVPRRNREDWLDAQWRLSPPPFPADVAATGTPPEQPEATP